MPQLTAERARPIIFVLIVFFWILSNPDVPALISDPDAHASRRERQDMALSVLNSSSWNDFAPALAGGGNDPAVAPKYLNLTGFRNEEGLSWDKLDQFKNRCRQFTNNAKVVRDGQDRSEILVEPIWQNASGMVRGPWGRSDISSMRRPTDYNLTAVASYVDWIHPHWEWSGNITGTEGSLMLKLDDAGIEDQVDLLSPQGKLVAGGKARKIKAILSVQDTVGSGLTFDMALHGVHWVHEGSILVTTTSPKFAGIFGLPHLAPSSSLFESSRQLLNRTLWHAAESNTRETGDPYLSQYSSALEGDDSSLRAKPHCEYLVYVQIHSIPPRKLVTKPILPGPDGAASIVADMENELQDPMGAPVPPIPAYHLSSVIYSPDCGHFLETTGPPDSTVGHHLLGLKAEVLHYHIRYWILGMATIFYGILTVTKAQFKLARTPSNVHRISVWSLLIMALADLMAFTSVTTMSLSSGRMFLPFLAAVFPCLALAGVEANFLSQVYKTQEPDRRRQFNARQRQGTATRSTPPPSSDALPRPVTDPGQTHGASRLPVIVPLDQDVDAGSGRPAHEDAGAPEVFFDTPFSTIMGWCMFGSTALLFLSIAATGWYPWVRALYANSVLFAYLSFWVPQIYRNAMRNSRRALSWHFMIGQSMLRLLPISYFYVYPSNIMFCDTDRSSFALMCAWIWVQLFVLACQDVLGSRLFIPQDWLPEAWEYHPVLKEDSAEGGGLPIGLFASPGSPGLERSGSGLEDDRKDGLDSSSRLRAIDCAICYEDVEVRVVRAGKEDASSTGVAGMLARRQYMVTPCRHIFHTACLESWMQLRLQCPICREELPPL